MGDSLIMIIFVNESLSIALCNQYCFVGGGGVKGGGVTPALQAWQAITLTHDFS